MMLGRVSALSRKSPAALAAMALLVLPATGEARPADPVATAAAASTTVSGRVYEDRDAGGRGLRSGDAGLDGWRVWLDRDRDARYDRGEPATTTRSVRGRSGSYSLRTRARGTGLIRAAPAGSVASRWRSSARRCTEPSSCRWSVRLRPGSSVRGKDFGWYQTATISGSVYEDEDGDGLRDPPEFGLSGWRVWLDRDRDGVFDPGEPSDVTAGAAGPAGVYAITGVKPSAAAAPLRHAEVEPVGVTWQCTQPVTTDGHGCFTEVRPRSGDRLERDLGDHATEPTTPAPHAARPPAARAQRVGGLQIAVAVVSDDGGSLAEVTLRVLQGGLDIEGSPRPSSAQGADFTLAPGTYTVDVGRRGRLREVGGRRLRRERHDRRQRRLHVELHDHGQRHRSDAHGDHRRSSTTTASSAGAGCLHDARAHDRAVSGRRPGVAASRARPTGATFTVPANETATPTRCTRTTRAPLHYQRHEDQRRLHSTGSIVARASASTRRARSPTTTSRPPTTADRGRLADHDRRS